MESVGIIGFGSFGKLLARLLAPHVRVLVCDRRAINPANLPPNARAADIAGCAQADLVIIAADLSGIESICRQLAPLVTQKTIVMDICSVKVRPAAILAEVLAGKCRLLATHPMFGPNSVQERGGCQGMTMVWHELSEGDFGQVKALFADRLELDLLPMTPDEHDQQMAWVHGLTFFVGRGLVNTDIPKLTLDSGYYSKLLALCELEKTHSLELFRTIELGNPYAKAVRQQFMTVLTNLATSLERNQHDGQSN